jgi:hypothetical protein
MRFMIMPEGQLTGRASEVLGRRAHHHQGLFRGENELPAGFSILRVQSLDEAIEWASRQAAVLGDVEIDIRPVTEGGTSAVGGPPRSGGVNGRSSVKV